jgi:predicted transcriptional regulator
MAEKSYLRLSRRERQIMDALYRRGKATATELQADLPDPPSNAAVRAKLRVLEEKGFITHAQDGPRYLYRPVLAEGHARTTAMRHLLQTFFAGSIEGAMTALLRLRKDALSQEELDRLAKLIDQHRSSTK